MSAKKASKPRKPQKQVSTLTITLAALLVVGLVLYAGIRLSKPKAIVPDEPTVFTPTHRAEIVIRDYGTITVELDGNAAPETVENFVSLAQSGFYDGLTFHRIIEGFMMQGGAPTGTGSSGKTIKGEFTNNGVPNTLSHTRGAISMARSQNYNSASSQFFIVHQDASENLDGDYAVFGYVSEGMEIVDKICADARPIDNDGLILVEERPRIERITILE